jgi:hypothetical protein
MSELESLRQRHKELETEIAAIDAHLSLTAKEQAQRAMLKKEKLVVKDRIQILLARPL